MKTHFIKSDNKNSIHTTKTRAANNSDTIVTKGSDGNVETTRSKTSETNKPVSKAGTTKGKLLVTSSHDAARSTKAAKHPAGKERMPSTMKSRQQQLKQAVMQVTNASIVTCIDKLWLSVPLTATQLDAAVHKALQLVKQKRLTHRSSKRHWFKYLFVLTLDGGSKVIFNMVPNKTNIKEPMQVIFNPNHITASDTHTLISVWKALFGLQAREVAESMKIMRIDINADSTHLIEDLIIELDGAKVGSKFFVKTDTGGKMQTSYVGSTDSAHHGIAYDQDASDDYKVSVGEVVGRQKPRENAELVFEQTEGRTRIESRRVFKPHVTIAELAAMTNPFTNYKVYDISKATGKKFGLDFLTYLDCVRIRGINGANRHLSKACENSKEGIATIHAHEQRLTRLAAPWWRPQDFNASLLTVLKKSPVWAFLKVMEK